MLNSRRQKTYKPELANTELQAYASLCSKLSDSNKNAHLSYEQIQQAQQAIEEYGYVVPFYQQFCRQVKGNFAVDEKYMSKDRICYTKFIRDKLEASDQLKQDCRNDSVVSLWVDDVLQQEKDQRMDSQKQKDFLKVLAQHDERSALYYIRFLVDKIEKGLYAERLFNAKAREQFVSEYFDECKQAIKLYQRWQLTVENPEAGSAASPDATDAFRQSLQNTKQRYENLTPKDYAGLLQLNSEQNQETQSNSTPSNFSKLPELQHTHLRNIEDYINGKNKKTHRHTNTTGDKLDIANKALRELLNYFFDADYSKSQLQQQLNQFINKLPGKKQQFRKDKPSQLGEYLENLKDYVQDNFPDQKPLQAMANSQYLDVLAIIHRIDGIQRKCNKQLTTYLDKDKTHKKLDQSQFNELQQQSKTDVNDAAYQKAITKNIQKKERIRACQQTKNSQQAQNNTNQNSKYEQIAIENLRQQNSEKVTRYDNGDNALSGFENQDASISSNFQPEELKKRFENIEIDQPRSPFANYQEKLNEVVDSTPKSANANKSNDDEQESSFQWFDKLNSPHKVSNISDLITVGFLNLNENWKGKDNKLTDKALLWQQFANQVDPNNAGKQVDPNNACKEDAKAIRNSIPDALKNYFKQINQGGQSQQLIDKVVDMVWQRLLNQGKKRWWPCKREITKAANIFHELENLCRSPINNDKTVYVRSFLEKTQKPNNNQGKRQSSEQKGNNNQGKSQSSEQKANNTEELFITTWDLTYQLKQSTSMFSCFCFWKKDMATDLKKRLNDDNKSNVSITCD